MKPSQGVPAARWRAGASEPFTRELPQETPVALVHDATTTAVMMATPADLEDFGLGFSLTEQLIADPSEMTGLEVVAADGGIEVRIWLRQPAAAALAERRRVLAGPTGCGLCGVDSLAQAVRPPPPVRAGYAVTAAQVQDAIDAIAPAQTLGAATRAVHAAGWWTPAEGLVALREDVGRHNALDKLVGALASRGHDEGVLVLTSRVSVEMVQKAAVMGAQVLVAISAPTTLAVRTAEACGLTLVAVARDDGFEVFSRGERIAH